MKKFFTIIGLVFTLLTATIPAALAQVSLDPNLHPEYAPVVVIQGGTSADYGNYFLQLIAGGLLYLAAPVAILIIAISGLRYVTSHGDQNALEGAKKTLEWAIIGLLVIMLAYGIVRVVISTVLTTPTAQQTTTQQTTPSTPSGGESTPGGGNSSGGESKPGG